MLREMMIKVFMDLEKPIPKASANFPLNMRARLIYHYIFVSVVMLKYYNSRIYCRT